MKTSVKNNAMTHLKNISLAVGVGDSRKEQSTS